MPESSLTEETAIPPAGNVFAARVPAGHASGVNVTGIQRRMAGQSPTRSMTIDANAHGGDDPMFSTPSDAYPFIELPVERDMPVIIHCDRPIFGLPWGIEEPIASRAGGGGSSLPSGTRMSISLSSTSLSLQQDRASKLLSRKVD